MKNWYNALVFSALFVGQCFLEPQNYRNSSSGIQADAPDLGVASSGSGQK